MPDHDSLTTAFAEFRAEQLPQIRPAGLAPVRVTARRRRRVRIAGLSVLALVAVVAAGPAVSHWNLVGSRPQSPTGPGVVTDPRHWPTCGVDEITVQVTGNGAVASQPWVVISFINSSTLTCQLTGYPRVTAVTGHLAQTPDADLAIPFTVYNGPLYSRSDPGQVPVTLEPGAAASFALGTATAHDDIYLIKEVVITMPGDTSHLLVVIPPGMQGGADHGQNVGITVTGVTAGTNGIPQ